VIEFAATILLPLIQIFGLFALPAVFIQTIRSPRRMPWGMRLEFTGLILLTSYLLFVTFVSWNGSLDDHGENLAIVVQFNRDVLTGLFLTNPADHYANIVSRDALDAAQMIALVVLAVLLPWLFLKPVYVLGKWVLNGFKRPESGIHPLLSALMPIMIIFSPVFFTLVVAQTLLETFGMAVGLAIGSAVFAAQVVFGLLFLAGFGDFMRRRR
jgi:hypothetical protein